MGGVREVRRLLPIAQEGVLHRVLRLVGVPQDGQGGTVQGGFICGDHFFQPVGVCHLSAPFHPYKRFGGAKCCAAGEKISGRIVTAPGIMVYSL